MFSFQLEKNIKIEILKEQYSEELFALVDGNRNHLKKWLTWLDDSKTVESSRNFIALGLKRLSQNKGFESGVWFENKIAGVVGVYINPSNNSATIGYWLGQNFQKNGIITKTCQAIINHLFEDLKINRVEIRCATKNNRSIAIPERLGFKNEGILRDAELLYGKFHDLIVFGMLAKDWK